MKSYGHQLVEQVVEGDLPLVALYNWADQWGRKAFDPSDKEDLYLSALVQGYKHDGDDARTVIERLAAALDTHKAGDGI